MESILDLPIITFSRVRSAGFTVESQALYWLSRIFLKDTPALPDLSARKILLIEKELQKLIAQDSANIRNGLYPVSVLKPESPVRHLLRIPHLIADGLKIATRRRKGRTTEFDSDASEMLEDLPRYYRRNFHFQTNGYLSRESAELYEHQVEILFGGAADAMRRLVIPALKKQFPSDGKGLRFLEIGAGTGRSTQFVRQAFPKARIVASDLSEPYLRFARNRLSGFPGIDFIQANGSDLPFQDGKFDAVFSVFLFHELPFEERMAVLKETSRVLKKGGFISLVDSVQLGDLKEFDSVLGLFPRDFHEPFYRNYIENPMEKLLAASGFKAVESSTGFFSKLCSAIK